MRAHEFINESLNNPKSHGTPVSVSKRNDDTLPGVFVQQQLRNTDPYMQYRYALAIAAARANRDHGVEFNQETAWAENLTQVMYTPEDEETIRLASKLLGVTPTRITGNASEEPTDTNKTSIVATVKRNKYGI